MKTEKISRLVLYGLVAVVLVVFGLFFLVGYDHPYVENSNYNAPVLTDLVLVLMLLLVVGTIGVTAWAVMTALKKRGRGNAWDNNVPVRRISYSVILSVLLLLALAFVLGSSSAMFVNGKPYEDTFWLKTADMFIISSIVLLVVAAIAFIFGATRYYRKKEVGSRNQRSLAEGKSNEEGRKD